MNQKLRERRVSWKALDIRVLVVAVEGYDEDWSAYIGAVRGDSHRKEWEGVKAHGSKLPENVARLLFPGFRDLGYRY